MYYTYVLYSPRHDKIYVGYTSNLQGRLDSHNIFSQKGWTINFRPWDLLYSEQYPTKQEAMKREKELKSAKGREFIWQLVRQKYS